MILNGHAAVQEWQTACASAGKDFTDKLIQVSQVQLAGFNL